MGLPGRPMGVKETPRRLDLVSIALWFLIALIIGFVVWTQVSPINFPWQRVDVSMEATAVVEGRTVKVTGTTSVPDGAIIDYYFWREPYDDAFPEDGNVVVANGMFAFTADLAALPPGAANVNVGFECSYPGQPAALLDLFGTDCEHLAGDQMYVDSPGDPKQLSVTVNFRVP
jgi:hypothetical protein